MAQNPQRPIQPPQPGVYPQPVTPPQPAYPQPVYPQPVYPQAVASQPAQPSPPQPYPQPAYPQPAYPQPQAYPNQPQPMQPYAVPNQSVLPNQPIVPNQPVYANQPVARAQPIPVQPVPVQPAEAQPIPVQPRQVQPAQAHPRPVQQATPLPPSANRPMPVSAAAAAVRPQSVNAPVPVAAAASRPVPVGTAKPAAPRPQSKAETKEEEEQKQTAEQVVIRRAPPWLVSAIVHALFLIVAGMIYLSLPGKNGVELNVIFAEELGVQLENADLTTGLMEPVNIEKAELSLDTNPVDNPLAAMPAITEIALEGVNASSDITAPSIGMALTGREKGMKKALLGKYGGTATTEEAVKRALEWLKRNQEKEGTWSLVGPYSSPGGFENKTAATAMALLAFQGAGNTHKQGDFQKEVARGWNAFSKMQDRDGMFEVSGVHNHRLYAQAQATIALCELYGMTKDKQYREPAQKAIDYAVKIQDSAGGWRYIPGQDSDTSVTGWFVMALQSGLMAGLEVPSPTLDKISKFLDSVQKEDGAKYAYRPGEGDRLSMTAEGLLCRQYLGWKHNDPRLNAGVSFVVANPINWGDKNVYYWYYATQAAHHMEGEHWQKWNSVMRQTLPDHQEKTGKEAGSWDPGDDNWGNHGGRLFTTCLCTYMLEVYYRHLPIYKYRVQ